MPITNTFIRLERQVLTSSSNTITFSNINSTYTDLYLFVSARTDSTSTNSGSNAVDTCYVRLNNNLTNVSSTQYWEGVPNNAPTSAVVGPETVFRALGATTANASADIYANGYMRIPNYRSSTNKIITWDFVGENNAVTNALRWNSGFFNSTAAVTQIDIFPIAGNFVAGSTFTLYGVASAGTQNTRPTLKATGGVVSWDDTYVYHTFTSSGVFTPTQSLSVDSITIAGGGGGGKAGGGGGAGSLIYNTGLSLSATGYTVTIGAGGAGATTRNNVPAGSGSASVFGSTSATGGGGGCSNNNANGNGGAGGSGGGAVNAGAGGTASAGTLNGGTGYVNAGGGGVVAGNLGQGGGGSGAVGGTQSGANGGFGGNGTTAFSSWGVITSTGQNVSGTVYYAGGGAGYSDIVNTGGFGGGGSSGAGGNNGQSGTPNSGGGGGGSRDDGTGTGNGGSGGSGLVVVRYLK